jgi:hypothetical protein
VDPFVVIIVGGLLGLVIALLLIGRFYPGSGRELIDWQPTRSPELEAQNEIDDLEQLRELANRRRRRRGEAELTEDNLHAQLTAEAPAQAESSSERDTDIAELLELSNARRRRKGLPELTLEEYKAELES